VADAATTAADIETPVTLGTREPEGSAVSQFTPVRTPRKWDYLFSVKETAGHRQRLLDLWGIRR
jgi:hypothetical protein